MSSDTRPRYDVLLPIATDDGTFRWLRVGAGYQNPDGTLDAYLDVIVVGNRFRLREALAASATDMTATPKNGASHGE